jgi:UDP-glucose 4-epimerase
MKGRRIVVTGGAGFIGSNLTRALASENHVMVVDDLSTGHLENIQNLIKSNKIEFIKANITDLDLLHKLFRNVDYVFHEAAIPSVPKSVKDPLQSNFINVNGTLDVLVAARDNGVKKVVYASSSSVYGDEPTLPKKENMKPFPMSPYAVGKLSGEYYCQVFTDVYGLSTVSLRYFNVYGPYQDPNSEYAAVIPKFITRILNGDSPIIYGDGEQTRDFIFIGDVVHANILAAECDATGVFNIAGGKRVSMNDLAKSIMKICRKDLDIVHENPRPGDVRHSLADISNAKEKLNHEPKFNLTDGLKETIKWFQK